MQQVNLGIIGAGTVGGGVYQAIQKNGGLMASRLGVRLEIVKIAARDLKKPRPVSIPKGLLTNDWRSVVDRSEERRVGEACRNGRGAGESRCGCTDAMRSWTW